MQKPPPRFSRRSLLVSAATLASFSWVPARAQAFPAKPVKVIVAFPPGSGADTTARYYARRLEALTQQPFVVENRPGANGFIAAQYVARAEADGYTLFYSSNGPIVVNPVLFKTLPYRPFVDFVPIARTVRGINALVVPVSSPYKTVADLVAAAKKAPTKLNYGAGSVAYQIATEAFADAADVKFTYVPYKGPAPVVIDTVAGVLDFCLTDISAVLPLIQGGKLRALAVMADARQPRLPDVPTAAEGGVKGPIFMNWAALYAPARTPQTVQEQLEKLMVQVAAEPETAAFFEQVGLEQFSAGALELRNYQTAQLDMWKRAAQRANVQPE